MLSSAISVSVSPSRPRLAASLVMRMVNALLSFIGATKSATAWSRSSAGADEERAPDVEVADLRVVGGDREVAGDHQLEPSGDGVALDHGDGRLAEVERAVEGPRGDLRDLDRVVRRPEELRVEHVEVRTRAEGVAAPADQHDAHVVVVLGALEGCAELGEQRPVDAVLDLRPVQPDRGDAVVDLVLDDVLRRLLPVELRPCAHLVSSIPLSLAN